MRFQLDDVVTGISTKLREIDKVPDVLGIVGSMQSSIVANVIGRMAKPASELSTWNWLLNQSALPELRLPV